MVVLIKLRKIRHMHFSQSMLIAAWTNFHVHLRDIPQQTFQRCFNDIFRLTRSQPQVTPNQRWKNVVLVNVTIYNVKQRRISVVYFKVDINNAGQHQNHVVIFNVDFHSFRQRQNNVVNMIICKNAKSKHRVKSKTRRTYFLDFK